MHAYIESVDSSFAVAVTSVWLKFLLLNSARSKAALCDCLFNYEMPGISGVLWIHAKLIKCRRFLQPQACCLSL